MSQPATYQCPHCDATFEAISIAEPQFVACPACGEEVEVAAIEIETDHAAELDRNRIRQLTAARRASTRARSYCLIAAVLCAVGAIQLCWMAVLEIRAVGLTAGAMAEICCAILALAVFPMFLRSARPE